MKVQAFGLSDVGKKRSKNEDHYLVNEELGLYIVADGMGGHSGGEFASRFAVNTVEEVIQSMNTDPEATVISGVNSEETDFGDRLRYAIQVASQKIYDQAMFDQELRGMGTTIVAVLVQGDRLCVAHVGDSRGYLLRGGHLKQITFDHSLVSEQMRAGLISEKDAKNHRFKNIITRSVGYQEDVEIDLNYLEVKSGDRLLLCTDGLSNMLNDERILAIMSDKKDIREACQDLVNQANANGGDDNVTVLICEAVAQGDESTEWIIR